jgi:ketosteroid isomerase-like protein
VTRFACVLIMTVLFSGALFATDRSADEEKVWSLEQAYWQYVQDNDLKHYRGLWHEQFLGWPSVSPEPVRKDHITDWITAHTTKGESLKSYTLERLPVQVIDNIATTTYRVRLVWVDKNGREQAGTIRIVHTWLRNARGAWKIAAGMSAPTDAEGH